MYRMKSGLQGYGHRGLGAATDCSNPPLLSTFQAGAKPCQLGQGAATAACLAAQDNAEANFAVVQQAWNAVCSPGSLTEEQENWQATNPTATTPPPIFAPTFLPNAPTVAATATQIAAATPQAPPQATVVVNATPTPKGSQAVINSNSASQAPSTNVYSSSGTQPAGSSSGQSATNSTGFSLSSVPWWGWAGAAGLALVALSGKR